MKRYGRKYIFSHYPKYLYLCTPQEYNLCREMEASQVLSIIRWPKPWYAVPAVLWSQFLIKGGVGHVCVLGWIIIHLVFVVEWWYNKVCLVMQWCKMARNAGIFLLCARDWPQQQIIYLIFWLLILCTCGFTKCTVLHVAPRTSPSLYKLSTAYTMGTVICAREGLLYYGPSTLSLSHG